MENIKANELRIGNWVEVEYPDGKEFEQIYSIDDGYYSTYYPIPLTPEILDKAGFEEIGFYWHLNDVRVYEWHSLFEVNEGFIFDYGMTKKFLNVIYVHQLQNLYFAFTGEELSIEL